MEYKTFETERLVIRPTLEEDAEFIFELFNTPAWLQFIGDRNIHSVEIARHYIRTEMLTHLERHGFSSYTLITKDSKSKIGTCGLYDREGLEGIDIGFALLPAYERKGFAYEAANRIKEAALNDFGLQSICGITDKDNFPSQKLLKRLGLVFSGTTKLPGKDKEIFLYKLNP